MKNFVIAIVRTVLKIFFLFPIKERRIIFSSYSGKNYSCNPKYIFEYMAEECSADIEYIWAFNDPEKYRFEDDNVKKVRFKSLKYLYYALTAKVVVDNVESWSILPKRRGQYVINTWHGGGAYKGVGLGRRDTTRSQNFNMLQKQNRISAYVSSSRAFSKQTLRDSFKYSGLIFECGMPRNDILFTNDLELQRKIRKKLELKDCYNYLLYAPTFRNDLKYQPDIDYLAIVQALEKRFSGKWKILFRQHYYVESRKTTDDIVIDVSEISDMQELLVISDALITDYSSSMWDFSFTYRPGFLFVPDIDKYRETERALYSPIETWPYDFAKTDKQLVELIENYNYDDAVKKITKHHKALGSYENGEATKFVVREILKILEEKESV